MSDVIEVRKGETKYALFVRKNAPIENGIRFFTEHQDSLQVGVMERPKGHTVEPHQHLPRENVCIPTVAEALYIEEGKIKATVYDEEWNVLAEQELTSGDFLVFLKGGHSIDVLEPTRMMEVKQGPFRGDAGAKVYKG